MVRPTLPSDLLNVSGPNVAKAGHVMGGKSPIAAAGCGPRDSYDRGAGFCTKCRQSRRFGCGDSLGAVAWRAPYHRPARIIRQIR
jgi:hypothetical protein